MQGWDWIGYNPGDSPLAPRAGPQSPKKRSMSFKMKKGENIMDIPDIEKKESATQKTEVESPQTRDKDEPKGGRVISSRAHRPNIPSSVYIDEHEATGGVAEAEEEIVEVESEEEETEFTDDASYDEKGAVEVEDEETEEEYDDERDANEEEQEASTFESMPPPIHIPEALRNRKAERMLNGEDDGSSDDDDSSETEDDNARRQNQRKSQTQKANLRPGTVRGMSFDHDDAVEPPDSGNYDNWAEATGEKAEPEPEPPRRRKTGVSLRPGMFRGQSFDSDNQEDSSKPPSDEHNKTNNSDEGGGGEPTTTTRTPNRPRGNASLRPGTVRGKSFVDDFPGPPQPVASPGDSNNNNNNNQNDGNHAEETTKTPNRPRGNLNLRPGTVRGMSFDDDHEGPPPQPPSVKQQVGKLQPENNPFASPVPHKGGRPTWRSPRTPNPITPKKENNAGFATPNRNSLRSPKAVSPKGAPKSPAAVLKSPTTAPKSPTAAVKSPTSAVKSPVQTAEDGSSTPAWCVKLRTTDIGEKMKTNGNLANPVTGIKDIAAERKELAFEKPEWTKKHNLRSSKAGEKLKYGQDIKSGEEAA